AVAQGLFRNPLADPYLLGSASGAALGGAAAMVFSGTAAMGMEWLQRLGMTGMAFAGGAAGVLLRRRRGQGVQSGSRLLLSGAAGHDRYGLCRCGCGRVADADAGPGRAKQLAPVAGRRGCGCSAGGGTRHAGAALPRYLATHEGLWAGQYGLYRLGLVCLDAG